MMRHLNNFCVIDIGCTNIKMMALVNNKPIFKTFPSGDDLTQKQLVDIIHDFYLSFNNDFEGLGIAFSGCTTDSMKVDRTTLQCLEGLSVDDFSDLNCSTIRLINDSNATTLAGTVEYPNSKVLVGFTNGTGIGCGISIQGNLFTGSNGFLGEIYGNPIVDEKGNINKIGRICSGSKILKKLNQAQTETDKKEIIHHASMYCGTLLVHIIHLYNPDVVYFSGGGFSYEGFLNEIIQFTKNNCYPHFTKNLVFAESSYQGYSGCVGAMQLVSQEKIG